MRLIDADDMIAKYGNWYTEEGPEEGFIGTIKDLVEQMPTITSEWRWIPCEICLVGVKRMIESISITPVYNNGENLWGLKQITGFGIFIDCDRKEADEILNLVKEMLDRGDPTESEGETDNG